MYKYTDIRYVTPQHTFGTIPPSEVESLLKQWGSVSTAAARAEADDPKCPLPQLYAKVAAVLQWREEQNEEARRRLESPEFRAKVNAIHADRIASDKARIMGKVGDLVTEHLKPATMGKPST